MSAERVGPIINNQRESEAIESGLVGEQPVKIQRRRPRQVEFHPVFQVFEGQEALIWVTKPKKGRKKAL